MDYMDYLDYRDYWDYLDYLDNLDYCDYWEGQCVGAAVELPPLSLYVFFTLKATYLLRVWK